MIYYRLRIRNAADNADECIFSSDPEDYYGGINCVSGVPDGDGQSYDPLSGQTTVGAYHIDIDDIVITGTTRAVTQHLNDANGRQQLLGRRTYIEMMTVSGSIGTGLVAGFLNTLVLSTGITYTATIGESRLLDDKKTVFSKVTPKFGAVNNLMGPMEFPGDPFDPFNPAALWRFDVIFVNDTVPYGNEVLGGGDGTVAIRFKDGWVPDSEEISSYSYSDRFPTIVSMDRANGLAAGEFVPSDSVNAPGSYPGIDVYVMDEDDNVFGPFIAQAQITAADPKATRQPYFTWTDGTLILYWPNDGSQPAVNDVVKAWAYRRSIADNNPLHISGHPVQILADLYDENNVAYDATQFGTAVQAVGPATQVVLRITSSRTIADFTAMLAAISGFGIRFNGSGKREIFAALDRPTGSEAVITNDQLRSADPIVWQVDEQTIKNLITVKDKALRPWQNSGAARATVADDLMEIPRTAQYLRNQTELDQYGESEQVFELPGTFTADEGPSQAGQQFYHQGLGVTMLDRFGRGAIYSDLLCTPDVTAKLGDYRALILPQRPGDNVRGSARFAMVVQRTEQPEGPALRFQDIGLDAKTATVPDLDYAGGGIQDTRQFFYFKFNNAAAMNAEAGATLRIEWGFGASPPSDRGQTMIVYLPGQIPTGTIISPEINSGVGADITIGWIRARVEHEFQLAGDWCDWLEFDSAGLIPPGSPTADDNGYGGIILHWAPGEADLSTLVFVDGLLVGIVPPGTRYLSGDVLFYRQQIILGLKPGTSYDIILRHIQSPPFTGASGDTTATITTDDTSPGTPPPVPTDPVGYSVSNHSLGKSLIGLTVTANLFPANVEFQVGVETNIGSGSYGSYQTYQVVTLHGLPDQSPTKVTGALEVPQDGLRRALKARVVRLNGAYASSYTTPVVVDPATTTVVLRPYDKFSNQLTAVLGAL